MSSVAVKSSSLGYFVFDATFRETHNFTNAITQNPVQTGAAINDNAYSQPIILTCDVGVTDCSFPTGSFGGNASRSLSAFGVLAKLSQSRDVMDVTTSFGTYQNMMIKSFIPIREPKTMLALRATVVFQQVIVTNAVEISVAQKKTTAPQTTGKTTSGTKSTKTTPNSSAPSLGDKIKDALTIIGKDFQELFSSR